MTALTELKLGGARMATPGSRSSISAVIGDTAICGTVRGWPRSGTLYQLFGICPALCGASTSLGLYPKKDGMAGSSSGHYEQPSIQAE